MCQAPSPLPLRSTKSIRPQSWSQHRCAGTLIVLHRRRNSVSRATPLTKPGLTDTTAQGCFSSSTHPQKSGPLAKSEAILYPASGSWNSTGHPLWLFATRELLSSLSCAQTGMNGLASPARYLDCSYLPHVSTTAGHRDFFLEILALPFSVKATQSSRNL